MQKLEAVNRLLTIIRERTISSLEQPLNEDARYALELLDRKSEDIQRKGWSFNTDRDFDLPLSDGEIPLPESTLKVVVSKLHAGPDGNPPHQRGDRLYNPVTRDYKFTAPVRISKLVTLLDWDDIPPVAQAYIQAAAEVQMIHGSNMDDAGARVALRNERDALIEMKRLYSTDLNLNMFDGPDVPVAGGRRTWRP